MGDQFIQLEDELINKNSIHQIYKTKRDPSTIYLHPRNDDPSKLKDCICVSFGNNKWPDKKCACEGTKDFEKLFNLFKK
jgi:hypothetical protein